MSVRNCVFPWHWMLIDQHGDVMPCSHGSLPGLNELVINNSVAGTNSPYTGPITGFGLNDDIVIGPATLPSLDFAPGVHVNYAETVLPMRDGLPKLKDFPEAFGGSGEAMAE